MDTLINEVSIVRANFDIEEHRISFVKLINEYIADDMGLGSKGLLVPPEKLVKGIMNYPTSFVLFAKRNNKIVGMAVCFEGFSTFLAMPLINIHDLVVYKKYRRQGLARKLLEAVEIEAEKRGCCKITLEVREDNVKAKGLYTSLDYGEHGNHMLFWSKKFV